MSLVNGKRQISTPHSSDICWPSSWNSLRNTSGRPPHMPNFVKIGLRGWAGRTPSLSHVLVIPFVFCLCILRTASWPYHWTDYDAWRLIGRVFRQDSAFWRSRWWKIMFRGQTTPNVNFGGPNMRFKPNLEKFRLTISSKLLNWSRRNLNTGFRSPVRLCVWSSIATQ